MIPTYEQAFAILKTYNNEPFHIQHAQTVAGVMRWFAETHDPEHAAYWEVVGLLHDIDFEQFADEHCVKGFELLRGHDVDESIIRAAMSHGYGIAPGAPQPEHVMEKVLFATDELTGLIGAVALMRPSRSVMDLEVKSVLKKFKTHSFAAGCSRDVILQGAAMLGWELDELISQTILAMRAICES